MKTERATTTRTCPHCNETFESDDHKRVFCKPEHAILYHREKRRIEKLQPQEKIP